MDATSKQEIEHTMIEQFIKAILGQYPRPVSRREYISLICDNAALASALEQKECARVLAVAEIRQLQQALDDAQCTIEVQRTEIERLQELALYQAQITAQLTTRSFRAGEMRWVEVGGVKR